MNNLEISFKGGGIIIYVMSDIHGDMDSFINIMQQINLQADDTLYILGDVIDRGPDGIAILQKIIKSPNVKMLLGNHEHIMLNYFDKEYRIYSEVRTVDLWKRNHGMPTLESFKKLSKKEQTEILEFLKQLPINIDIEVNDKKYKLVHSFPLEFYPHFSLLYHDETEFSVWERIDELYFHKFKNLEYTTIFGHTPTVHYQKENPMKIWKHDSGKLIGIDCGCAYRKIGKNLGGILGCIRLDDMREYYAFTGSDGEKL